jgi:chromo domain-containing protein 1
MGKSYKVEDVMGRKEVEGEVFYRIKWEGYPSWQNTWEPANNLNPNVVTFWQEKEASKKIAKENRDK